MGTFLALLLAHIIADFFCQPKSWVAAKRAANYRAWQFYAHIGVVVVFSYIFLGNWANPLPAILVGLIHGAIDLSKSLLDKSNSTAWFVSDQIAHIVSIAYVAALLRGAFPIPLQNIKDFLANKELLAYTAGLLLCLTPISILVGLLTRPWRKDLDDLNPKAEDTLDKAGRWIGMTERALIFVFIMIGEFSAIGFLIAAKSLLRYSEKAADQPAAYIAKKSEYVLVGTLLSYSLAVGVALVMKMAISS